MRYTLIVEWQLTDFERAIEEHLRQGWCLFGSPFSHKNNYCQAVIKEVKDE